MLFRQIAETEPAPMSRVEAAFGDWDLKDLRPPRSPNRPGPEPAPGQETIEVMKTVVALTRFVPSSTHPIGRELTVRTLHRIFFEALAHLDALLAPLGWVSGRWGRPSADPGRGAARDPGPRQQHRASGG
jgi:hypothetical protein